MTSKNGNRRFFIVTGALILGILAVLGVLWGSRSGEDRSARRAVEAATAEPAPTAAETAAPAPTATAAPTRTPTRAPTAEPTEVPPEETAAPRAGESEILITCVGDCTLGGDVPSGGYRDFASMARSKGPAYFLKNIKPLLEADDLTIVNLEGPLTGSNDKRKYREFNFRGYPQYAKILSAGSVEVANVANNHALDYGRSGLEETKRVLEAEGIGVSGFDFIWHREINGIVVCSVGFTEWDFSEREIRKNLSYVRQKCDLLIVSMHWGLELKHEPTTKMKRLAKLCVDAGADLVIGNHSHRYGGLVKYRGKYIIYSLGNFCFGGNRHPSDMRCTIFQQRFVFRDGQLTDGGINLIPASISSSASYNNYQPTLLTGDAVNKYLRDVYSVSSVDASQIIWIGGDPGPDLP